MRRPCRPHLTRTSLSIRYLRLPGRRAAAALLLRRHDGARHAAHRAALAQEPLERPA